MSRQEPVELLRITEWYDPTEAIERLTIVYRKGNGTTASFTVDGQINDFDGKTVDDIQFRE